MGTFNAQVPQLIQTQCIACFESAIMTLSTQSVATWWLSSCRIAPTQTSMLELKDVASQAAAGPAVSWAASTFRFACLVMECVHSSIWNCCAKAGQHWSAFETLIRNVTRYFQKHAHVTNNHGNTCMFLKMVCAYPQQLTNDAVGNACMFLRVV